MAKRTGTAPQSRAPVPVKGERGAKAGRGVAKPVRGVQIGKKKPGIGARSAQQLGTPRDCC